MAELPLVGVPSSLPAVTAGGAGLRAVRALRPKAQPSPLTPAPPPLPVLETAREAAIAQPQAMGTVGPILGYIPALKPTTRELTPAIKQLPVLARTPLKQARAPPAAPTKATSPTEVNFRTKAKPRTSKKTEYLPMAPGQRMGVMPRAIRYGRPVQDAYERQQAGKKAYEKGKAKREATIVKKKEKVAKRELTSAKAKSSKRIKDLDKELERMLTLTLDM